MATTEKTRPESPPKDQPRRTDAAVRGLKASANRAAAGQSDADAKAYSSVPTPQERYLDQEQQALPEQRWSRPPATATNARLIPAAAAAQAIQAQQTELQRQQIQNTQAQAKTTITATAQQAVDTLALKASAALALWASLAGHAVIIFLVVLQIIGLGTEAYGFSAFDIKSWIAFAFPGQLVFMVGFGGAVALNLIALGGVLIFLTFRGQIIQSLSGWYFLGFLTSVVIVFTPIMNIIPAAAPWLLMIMLSRGKK